MVIKGNLDWFVKWNGRYEEFNICFDRELGISYLVCYKII